MSGGHMKSGPPPALTEHATILDPNYSGPIPEFPLAEMTDREDEIWQDLWSRPMAEAWTDLGMWDEVALFTRRKAASELHGATAATIDSSRRLGDDIGISPIARRRLNWIIAKSSGPEQRGGQYATPQPYQQPAPAPISDGPQRRRSYGGQLDTIPNWKPVHERFRVLPESEWPEENRRKA